MDIGLTFIRLSHGRSFAKWSRYCFGTNMYAQIYCRFPPSHLIQIINYYSIIINILDASRRRVLPLNDETPACDPIPYDEARRRISSRLQSANGLRCNQIESFYTFFAVWLSDAKRKLITSSCGLSLTNDHVCVLCRTSYLLCSPFPRLIKYRNKTGLRGSGTVVFTFKRFATHCLPDAFIAKIEAPLSPSRI